ncbi:MAG: hypothetical protein WDA59_00115 [Methanofastidiosum sp.]
MLKSEVPIEIALTEPEFKDALDDYERAKNIFQEATGDAIDEAVYYLNSAEARLMRIIKAHKLAIQI